MSQTQKYRIYYYEKIIFQFKRNIVSSSLHLNFFCFVFMAKGLRKKQKEASDSADSPHIKEKTLDQDPESWPKSSNTSGRTRPNSFHL